MEAQNGQPSDEPSLENMAKVLEGSGDFRVLRRLVPRPVAARALTDNERVGILVDTETTGLDTRQDEVVELAMVKFHYTLTGRISGVTDVFEALAEPSRPLSEQIKQLTGLTDEMLAGQAIDPTAVEAFLDGVNLVCAHNSNFDRRICELRWSGFAVKPWCCSSSEIAWREQGFAGANLGYLLGGSGYFHDAHRATADCHALLQILDTPLRSDGRTAFAHLLEKARRRTFRIWAEHAPYDLRNLLKARGYRWSSGDDGGLKAWFADIDEASIDQELGYLRTEIYQRFVDLPVREITAIDRFSVRADGPE